MYRLCLWVCCTVGLGSCLSNSWADFPELFNTEPLPEQTRLDPQTAAAKTAVPDGFKVSVFASEPDVQNPIAMSWDARGRLWVAENYTYASRDQRFQLDLRDRVVIFDNTQGDQFSKRTVFTDNVTMLTGLEVAPDGVWLMCPPQLIFIPDEDHDDVPDNEGQVVLDGFTVAQNNYHNFANGLRFGPDGWLYGRCGGSCPGRIGIPGTPDHQRLALEGGIWRYHPVRRSVEVLTSGTTNPWGHDWNEFGELFFTNTVNGHLWHAIPGAHFVRPFLLDPNRRTYELIDFHADHWHFDTGKSWTDSRDGAANAYGGGHAHSGAMIYQGDNWPAAYRGNLFTFNLHGRRANQEILVRDGSGYVGKHGNDFFVSPDTWFRGMEMSSGPDGAVFAIDWSDTGECHEHTGVHRTSGRIYKIRYESSESSAADPPLDKTLNLRDWEESKLVAAHAGTNRWHRRQARLELIRRSRQLSGDDQALTETAAQELKELFRDSGQFAVKVQSLLTLHAIEAVDREFLLDQLEHPEEHVRVWAIRLLTEGWPLDDTLGPPFIGPERADQIRVQASSLLPQLVEMARQDSSALVRLTLASTLQRLPISLRPSVAAALVTHAEDADDHNLPLMIWYGLIAVADTQPKQLVPVAASCELPTTLRLIALALSEEMEQSPESIDGLIKIAAKRGVDFQRAVLTGMSEGLRGWRQAPLPESWPMLAAAAQTDLQPIVRELSVVFGDGRAMDELKAIVLDSEHASASVRLSALQTLIDQEPDDLRAICQSLLRDQRMNVLAARGLSKFDDPEIGKALVNRYRNFRAPFRPQVISILVSRRAFARELLTAIERNQIAREDLSAYQVRQIHSLKDPELTALVSEVWGEVRETPAQKQQQIESLKKEIESASGKRANLANGRSLFSKLCQNCHKLYGEGESVGPDLTGSNRANLDYLLGNIIDPSGVVDKNYRMSVLLTEDGRIINGLILDETDRVLTVQTATEQLTFDPAAITSRKTTEKSPMPDGLLETLSEQQIHDLIGYLRHPSQVSLSEAN